MRFVQQHQRVGAPRQAVRSRAIARQLNQVAARFALSRKPRRIIHPARIASHSLGRSGFPDFRRVKVYRDERGQTLWAVTYDRVSALPHRHHGGDRLHRAAQNLPAGSGHIMTRDRRSRTARWIGVATLASRRPLTSLNARQAAKSQLWRSLEGSLGAVDACPLPSGMSRWCISKGHRGIQYP